MVHLLCLGSYGCLSKTQRQSKGTFTDVSVDSVCEYNHFLQRTHNIERWFLFLLFPGLHASSHNMLFWTKPPLSVWGCFLIFLKICPYNTPQSNGGSASRYSWNSMLFVYICFQVPWNLRISRVIRPIKCKRTRHDNSQWAGRATHSLTREGVPRWICICICPSIPSDNGSRWRKKGIGAWSTIPAVSKIADFPTTYAFLSHAAQQYVVLIMESCTGPQVPQLQHSEYAYYIIVHTRNQTRDLNNSPRCPYTNTSQLIVLVPIPLYLTRRWEKVVSMGQWWFICEKSEMGWYCCFMMISDDALQVQ